nr:hypothetical protein [Pandoravirus massiliensis]
MQEKATNGPTFFCNGEKAKEKRRQAVACVGAPLLLPLHVPLFLGKIYTAATYHHRTAKNEIGEPVPSAHPRATHTGRLGNLHPRAQRKPGRSKRGLVACYIFVYSFFRHRDCCLVPLGQRAKKIHGWKKRKKERLWGAVAGKEHVHSCGGAGSLSARASRLRGPWAMASATAQANTHAAYVSREK